LASLLAGRLSPVGEPISLERGGDAGAFVPDNYGLVLLNSGTAALSLALSLAANHAGNQRGEVILPAYACPDLLAAAYRAGLVPVLVDIGPDSPRYQPELLQAALGENTVAIVAVNFLGIAEDLQGLRALVRDRNILLIEDNAQYFPLESNSDSYVGDLVVHSFGRGKPISQIGGGALLARPSFADALASLTQPLTIEPVTERAWRFKARLFNLVLQPWCYQLLLMMPFLQIGATRYHALEAIESMPAWRLDYLQRNIDCYRKRSRHTQQQLDAQLEALAGRGLLNLPRVLGCQHQPLLRYPVLCDSEQRCDDLYRQLLGQGLGVSRMYERPLPEIEGIPEALGGQYAGAAQFASRLITLPLTGFVDQRRLDQICGVLASTAAV
jgi:dTDP-4-amino-4,6-dideoxygalactose transaminase